MPAEKRAIIIENNLFQKVSNKKNWLKKYSTYFDAPSLKNLVTFGPPDLKLNKQSIIFMHINLKFPTQILLTLDNENLPPFCLILNKRKGAEVSFKNPEL